MIKRRSQETLLPPGHLPFHTLHAAFHGLGQMVDDLEVGPIAGGLYGAGPQAVQLGADVGEIPAT
jgi:hypothetical protein